MSVSETGTFAAPAAEWQQAERRAQLASEGIAARKRWQEARAQLPPGATRRMVRRHKARVLKGR